MPATGAGIMKSNSRFRGEPRTKRRFELPGLVDEDRVLQPGDLVLHMQLFPLQLSYFQIIRRWMGHCLGNFLLQCLMPSLEFRKMGFDRHMACLLAWIPVSSDHPTPSDNYTNIYPISPLWKIPAVHRSALPERHAG